MTQPLVERILERLDKLDAQLQTLTRRVDQLEGRPEGNEVAAPAPPFPAPAGTAAAPTPTPRPVPPPLPTTPTGTSLYKHYEDFKVPPPLTSPATPNPQEYRNDTGAPATPTPARQALSPLPEDEPQPNPPEAEPLFNFDVKALLHQFHLMPPSPAEGENMEIQIGTWWATRIGVLLAIIAAVFFGVYVAQFARPWMRLAELTTVAATFTGLGLWLERRYPKYGSVLFGGGLAMLFFCAFGAYAIPAIKVLDSATAGAFLQFAAAAAIVGAALWRDSAVIANMGVIFGFVACFFSFYAGLSNFALLAGLTLAATAAWFYQAQNWPTAYVLSVPLAYLLYFMISSGGWMLQPRSAPGFWGCHAYLLGFLGVFAATDIVGLFQGRLLEPIPRRLIQLGSSSAAALLGFMVTDSLYHAQLSPYYFTYGIVLTALALLYYLGDHPDALMHGYFLKGSALVTMGLINAFAGRTRWIALGIESIILLFSARRSRLRIAEFMMGAVWVISLFFFFEIDHSLRVNLEQSPHAAPHNLFSTGGALAFSYVLLSAFFLALQARWLARPADAPIAGTAESTEIGVKSLVNVIYTLLFSIAILVFAYRYGPSNYQNLTLVLTLAAVGAVGYGVRHWIPFAALALPLIVANFTYWTLDNTPALPVWINGLVVIGGTAVAAILADHWSRGASQRLAAIDIPWLALVGQLHLLWMFTLQMFYGKVCPDTTFLLLAVLSAVAFTAAAQRWPLALLADLAPFIAAITTLRLLLTTREETMLGPEIFLWLAAALAWAYACAFILYKPLAGRLSLLKEQERYLWLYGAVAWLVGFFVLIQSRLLHGSDPHKIASLIFGFMPGDNASIVAFAVAALAVMKLARWPGFKPGLYLGLAYLILAHVVFYPLAVERGPLVGLPPGAAPLIARPFDPATLFWSIVLAGLTLSAAPLARRLRPDLSKRERIQLQWLCGTLTLLLCLILFSRQRGALAHYTTVFWGLSSIVIFLVGLLDRAKPLRITGLAGLALCIPRVFIVDVHSSLYRIAATGVLGAVVLLVAFLYSKYRAVISAWDNEG